MGKTAATFAIIIPVGSTNSDGEYQEFYGWDTDGKGWLYDYNSENRNRNHKWCWRRAEWLDHPNSQEEPE